MSSKVNRTAQSVPAQSTFAFPGKTPDDRPLWSEVDPQVLAALIQSWTDKGGAVLVGWTKDGSALNLSLYMGGGKANYTYGQSKAAENALREYTEYALDMAVGLRVPEGQ